MSANPTSRVIPFVLLLVLAAAIFLGGLGRLPLFGRDESLYAEAAREMAASGDWVTPRVNGGAFFEKPPLYYWMAAASYRVFGVSPFAARLPAALAGILSVVLVALIGARVWGRRAGLLAGLALATCLQMAIVGRMGIMDMPLAFLTILAMLAYARWVTKAGLLWAVAFGACVGLGVLLKGAAGGIPVGIALMDLAVRAAWGKRLRPSLTIGSIGRAAVALVVSGGIAAPWFMAMSARHGAAFSGTFLVHEHLRRIMQPMQGHGGPFWIYFWVYVPLIAFGFFPWVVLLPAGMLSRPVEETEVAARWRVLTTVWVAVVLVAFSAISTKLPGYVTPLYPAMALLVGAELDRRIDRQGRAPWAGVIIGGLALGVLVAMLPGLAHRYAAEANAENAVGQLVPGVMVWMGAYLLIVVGALIALTGATAAGVGMVTAGQVVVLGAVLIGILPVVAPYLEGGREYRLAQEAKIIEHARRQDEAGITMLYDTRPEAVAFVLGHSVPAFGRDRQDELLADLRAGPALLIIPVKDSGLSQEFAVEELARAGDRVLLDVRPSSSTKEAP